MFGKCCHTHLPGRRAIPTDAIFKNVHHRFVGKKVSVAFSLIYTFTDDIGGSQTGKKEGVYYDVDITLVLDKTVTIDIRRNPDYYGNVGFTLWNANAGKGVHGVTVTTDGFNATSDANGKVRLSIPIEHQKPEFQATASVPLQTNTLTMPCDDNGVILVE